VERVVEEAVAEIQPLAPGSLLLGSGGTLYNLGSVARAGGVVRGAPGASGGGRMGARHVHGAVLPHSRVSEMVDLFRSLPVKFRKRVPGLEPERADVILAGAMILHQLMAQLSAPSLVITTNGVRHGCIY